MNYGESTVNSKGVSCHAYWRLWFPNDMNGNKELDWALHDHEQSRISNQKTPTTNFPSFS